MAEERAQWGSSLEFVLTVIGYAVGLGNVWRFPFLVFRHGGAPFLIPFFIMLVLVGIPTFFLETAIGQFSALSPSHVFAKMAPAFQGLGYAAISINAFIGFYYNVIIAYCIYYFFFSMRAKLLWADCPPGEMECFQRNTSINNCTIEKAPYVDNNEGIDSMGDLQLPLVLALILAWFLVFAALVKGVQSLGKISYFTATFPYIMLTILVIRGALLDGAKEGINFYILSFDINKWSDPELWKDATTQVFYCLSACSGGLISMSSFSAFNNNLIRDALLVPVLDCLTGFYAGFAIFTVLGQMYITKCVDSFADVAAQGPELAFVVYPEGLSLMGKAAPLFSTLFFIMMLALGFGSEFSIMESVMSTVVDIFKSRINTKNKVILLRLAIVMVYFSLGLTMVTQGGLYILNLIDSFVSGYPLLVVGLLQVIVVPWIYGTKQLIQDIEQMIGPKPNWFWYIWIFSWRFLTPITLLAVLIASFIIPAKRLELNNREYPDYAVAIGWVIVGGILSLIPICAIYQTFKYRNNLKQLIRPLDEYYENARRNLKIDNKNESSDEDSKSLENHYELSFVTGKTNNAFEEFDRKSFRINSEDTIRI